MQIGTGFTLTAPVAPETRTNTPGPRRVEDQQTERPVTETGSTEPRQQEEVQARDDEARRELDAAERQERRDEDDEERNGDRVDIRV